MKFWTRYKPKGDNKELYRAFEKLRQVIRIKSSFNQTQDIIDILEFIRDSFLKLHKLKKTNKKRYEKLIQSSESNYQASSGLQFTLGIFLGIWEDLFNENKTELTHLPLKELIHICKILSQEKENEKELTYLIGLFHKTLKAGLKSSDPDKKAHLISSIYIWYLECKSQVKFQPEYIALFERNLFISLKYVINQDQFDLYKEFARHSIENIQNLPTPSGLSLFLISTLPSEEIKKELIQLENQLVKESKYICSQDRLIQWYKKYKKFKTLIDKSKYTKISDEEGLAVLEAFSWQGITGYKRNSFQISVALILSYALFKKRYSWVYYFLNYMHPPDADATWGNVERNPFPTNFHSLFILIANLEFGRYRIEFDWDDHHGLEQYLHECVFLFFVNCVRLQKDSSSAIGSHLFFNFSPSEKSILKYFLEKHQRYLVVILENAELINCTLKQKDWISQQAIPLLTRFFHLIDESQNIYLRESPISPEKIDFFKEVLFSSFNYNSHIRNILKTFCKNKIEKESPKNLHSIGIQEIVRKAAFIEEWPVDFSNYGSPLGEMLAVNDSCYLLNEIKAYCKPYQGKDLDDFFSTNPKGLQNWIIILVTSEVFEEVLGKETFSNFHPRPDLLGDLQKFPNTGFVGKIRNKIPVFKYYLPGIDPYIAIINKKGLGSFIQFNPDKFGEIVTIDNNVFSFSLTFFSENLNLAEKTLKQQATWLNELKHPSVEINEYGYLKLIVKSALKVNKSFEGWIINIQSD